MLSSGTAQIKKKPDQVCCIYATAPFVTSDDIVNGLNILEENAADYSFSATTFPFPIQRALKIGKEGNTEMFYPEYQTTRSQDLEEAFHDAGQFYWGTANAWTEEKPIFTSNSYHVLLPRHRVQDIDTFEDWERAEWLYKAIFAQK
jgi:pseudaminic acid cytidylyltransferase